MARLCPAEGSLHTAWNIGDGLVKSAQIGRIEATGISNLRKDCWRRL